MTIFARYFMDSPLDMYLSICDGQRKQHTLNTDANFSIRVDIFYCNFLKTDTDNMFWLKFNIIIN